MGRSESGKAAEWRERLRRFRASGMTVTRFCAAEGVSAPSFYAWRRKLNGEAAGSAAPTFQPVVVTAAASAAPGLVVRLAGGTAIEVGSGDLEVIRAVVGEVVRAERAFVVAEEDAAC